MNLTSRKALRTPWCLKKINKTSQDTHVWTHTQDSGPSTHRVRWARRPTPRALGFEPSASFSVPACTATQLRSRFSRAAWSFVRCRDRRTPAGAVAARPAQTKQEPPAAAKKGPGAVVRGLLLCILQAGVEAKLRIAVRAWAMRSSVSMVRRWAQSTHENEHTGTWSIGEQGSLLR
jgi:hypothetical protein